MVARIYHERGVGQRQIAASLHLSQARVSRLLRQAELEGIVRMVVLNLDRRIVGIDPATRRGIRAGSASPGDPRSCQRYELPWRVAG